MTSRIRPLVHILLGLAACVPADTGSSGDVGRPAPLDLGPVRDSIQAHVDRRELSGAIFAVEHGDGPVQTVRVGVSDLTSGAALDDETLFRLASATKIWVSAAFMTLVEDGRLDLDDPVAVHLPEFSAPRVFAEDGTSHPAAGVLTVRDLLRHTGGMGYGYADPYRSALVEAGLLEVGGRFSMDWTHGTDLAGWAARLATVPLEAEPATEFSYGLHHDLLGLLVERVSGLRLDLFVQERLIEPMGLERTGFAVAPEQRGDLVPFYSFEDGELLRVPEADSAFYQAPRAPSGGGGWDQLGVGGMVSSAADFLALLRMLRDGGVYQGRRILEASSVATLLRNQLEGIGSGDSFWPGVGFSFGFAYLYDPERYDGPGGVGRIWWAGSTNVYFWMDPQEQLSAVLMANVLPFGHLELMDAVERLTYDAMAAAGTE